MGINANSKIIPGHGTLFIADEFTKPPASGLDAFSLTGTPPTGWDNLGHTSKANLPAFSRDGGDVNKLDSWLVDGIATVVDAVAWSLGINPIQLDKDVLDLAFQGAVDTDGGYIIPAASQGVRKALFLLATDGTGKLGFWMPSTTVLLGDAPSLDAAQFVELPLNASIQPVTDEQVIASVNGTPGLMKVYKSGLVVLAPTIRSITPSGAATGDQVTLLGRNFTGVTAVKFASANATFTVIDDSRIVATVPTGSGGQVNVTATNPTGTSAPVLYTRAA